MNLTKESIEEDRKAKDLHDVVRTPGTEGDLRARGHGGCRPSSPDQSPSQYRLACREPVRVGYAMSVQQPRQSDEALMRRVAEHYHRTFRESQVAQDYLRGCGLTDPEMLRAFQIGYGDGSLLRMLDAGTRARLRYLGLISQRGGELFGGCVIFPLTDPAGGMVGIHGRNVTGGQSCYLTGSDRAVFHWQAMRGSTEVILTDGVLDALTLYQEGFRNAAAIGTVGGLTPESLDLLSRYRVQRVLICLTGHAAGENPAGAIVAALRRLGISAAEAPFRNSEGPNALLMSLGPERAAEVFRSQFAEARRRLRTCTTAIGERGAFEAQPPPVGIAVREGEAPRPDASMPPPATSPAKPEVTRAEGSGFLVKFPARTYRVRGLKENNLHQLRVNVRVDGNERMHVETLDLYGQRSRSGWLREAAREIGVPEDDLIPELHALIETLEGLRLTLRKRNDEAPPKMEMPDQEREAALQALRDPSLVESILADFERAGFVGETGPLTVGYLAAVSRLLDEPLGIFVMSRSGAGKTSLQEAICRFMPEESVVRYTRITEQALFYKGEGSLLNKVLAVDEERGAADATYSLRILQSAQQLTIGATRTDPHSGKLVTQEYSVRGPVAIFLTTASPDVLDPETRSRFVQVSIDESAAQTRRILERQRTMDTVEGLVRRREAEAIRRKHHNMQRLLRPLAVVNPFAPLLSYPDDRLQMRREQRKYLTLIKAVALLHQYQRDVKRQRVGDDVIEYVEVEPQDITLANRLAREVLGNSLDDLASHTRDLLRQLVRIAAAGARCFTREDVRRQTGWSYWSVREHLAHLLKMEYVVLKGGGNGKRMTYELLFDGDPDEDRRYLAGLVEVEGNGAACGTVRDGDPKVELNAAQPVPDKKPGPCGLPRKGSPDGERS
jgi:Toprim-like/DNA primase catalytic core, N-terminal domain